MAKRATFRINPETGKFEDVSPPEAPQPAEVSAVPDPPPSVLKVEEAAVNIAAASSPRPPRTSRNDPSTNGSFRFENSMFATCLSGFVSERGLPDYIENSREIVNGAETLKDFYDLFCDAYECAATFSLQYWFSSLFSDENRRPKVYASTMAHGSKVPLPFWGGPAQVDLGTSHGKLNCYSIATPKGYFGALSWDQDNVLMLTRYPDSRARDMQDCMPAEYRNSPRDYVRVVPWRLLEDMPIGEDTESMIDYCWSGSELRYELAKAYMGRARTLVEHGREPMQWEPRTWEVNAESYHPYYGKFYTEAAAQIVAKSVGGTVDPEIWWLACKGHTCHYKTEPFWVGIPECPACGDVMLHAYGTESRYKKQQ